MAARDYYEILGVGRNATEAEIKKAYRRLAQMYHPDKHQGDKGVEDRFKEINEAYEILKDPNKRAQYDRFGFAGMPGGGMGDFGAGFDFQDIFGDIFGDFFGTGRGRTRTRGRRGGDLTYEMEVNFEDIVSGVEKKVYIPRHVVCQTCRGSGAMPGTAPTVCPECKGSGQIRHQQGFFSISRPCSTCRGEGSVIANPCQGCGGSGRVKIKQSVTIRVPPGVETGTRLRLTGEGESGLHGGPPGDLYIAITVKPHPIFKRQNDDILCEVPISFPQAALGTEIYVPTIDGKVKVKIPHGTQSGKVFRLKGKGVPSIHTGKRGDENVIIKVETPTNLTERQKELLEEFACIAGDNTTPHRKGFFDKVKEMFG